MNTMTTLPIPRISSQKLIEDNPFKQFAHIFDGEDFDAVPNTKWIINDCTQMSSSDDSFDFHFTRDMGMQTDLPPSMCQMGMQTSFTSSVCDIGVQTSVPTTHPVSSSGNQMADSGDTNILVQLIMLPFKMIGSCMRSFSH